MALVFPCSALKSEETTLPLPSSETMSFQTTDQSPATPATDPAQTTLSNLEVEPAPLVNSSPAPDVTDDITSAASPTDQPSLEVTGAETGPGAVRWVVTASLQTMYDDNIFITSHPKESDLVGTIAPTFAIGLGDVRSEFRRVSLDTFSPVIVDELYEPRTFLFFRYTPTISIFVDHSDENVLNHDVAFEVRRKFAYLTLGSRSSFQTSSSPNIDVGSRVDVTTLSENLTAFYDYSERTSFEFNLTGSLRKYSGALLDSSEVESVNWINYGIGARTHVGLGFALGYLGVSGEDSQFYQQILVRAQYNLTEKISLSANAGLERREFGNNDAHFEPVFGGEISYQPFEQTTVSLATTRSIENSAGVADEDIVSTSVSVDVRQRFFGRYYLCFKGDYLNAEYVDTGSFTSFSRTDHVRSLTPYVRVNLTKAAAISAGYTSRRNDSTHSDFSFNQNQAFIQVNLLF